MDERERRLAANERLFREVNERIEQVATVQVDDDHVYEFVCECSSIDCVLRLPLTLAAYERARSDPTIFVLAPGHELPDIEEVVERNESWQLVRKHGTAAAVARAEDPRRDL